MAQEHWPGHIKKEYNNLYSQIISLENLFLAEKKARKGKTKRDYVIKFEQDLFKNLLKLHEELKNETYNPKPLQTFILRDPKTRKISKSDFRDRVVHHALVRIIEPIFNKIFIYDSYANRKEKGNLKAVERLSNFIRKVSRNGKNNGWFNKNQIKGYCLKADIKHYFQEVNHEILLNIIKRKITDKKVIKLIEKILENNVLSNSNGKGMPLGNLTSQFFANIYLNEFDYFIKHGLRVKFYIRYVDDFILLHSSKEQLEIWKQRIDKFLRQKLWIEPHSQKSRIISLSRGIEFVGFRNFYYFKLLRKRNIKNMLLKINSYKKGEISKEKLLKSFQGWCAYARWANSYNLRAKLFLTIIKQTFLSQKRNSP